MRIRQTEGTLMPWLLEYAGERFGKKNYRRLFNEALNEFLLWPDAKRPAFENEGQFEQAFLIWFAFHWDCSEFLPEDWENDDVTVRFPTIARLYLQEHGSRLSAFQRKFLEAASAIGFTFFLVLDAVPGESVTVRDLLLGDEFTAKERQGSLVLRRGHLVFGQVLEMEGTAIFLGLFPFLLPAKSQLAVLDFRHRLQDAASKTGIPWNASILEEYEIEIRDECYRIHHDLLNPAPPHLTNTDGEDLLSIQLRYRLSMSIEEAIGKLENLTHPDFRDGILKNAERNPSGTLRKVEIQWHRPEKRKSDAAISPTILAFLKLQGKTLTVEVNSKERSEKIQKEIEKRLGPAAKLQDLKIESTDKLKRKARGQKKSTRAKALREETEELNARPEIQAHLARLAQQHWKAWPDQGVPALGNITPREAAKTAEGRERLEALLMSFEDARDRVPPQAQALKPDLDALRKELGLEIPLRRKR